MDNNRIQKRYGQQEKGGGIADEKI